ncbi:MAG: hypothetical protein C0480_15075 [Bradyrhizobium sp.]|jgi:biotin operon repressor|nr:hypothetical protein [Bradyrhizobium sp.]
MTEEARMSPRWTHAEINELVGLWPTVSAAQIAKRLQRPRKAVHDKASSLRQKGLLVDAPRGRSINPEPQDFDAVKIDYCRKHYIDIAQLSAKFERDDKLAAELYQLAQAAKLTRLTGRLAAEAKRNDPGGDAA